MYVFAPFVVNMTRQEYADRIVDGDGPASTGTVVQSEIILRSGKPMPTYHVELHTTLTCPRGSELLVPVWEASYSPTSHASHSSVSESSGV